MTARARVGAVAVALVTVTRAGRARPRRFGERQAARGAADRQPDRAARRSAPPTLGEALNGAQLQLDQANTDVKASEAKLGDLQAKLASMRSALGGFAVRAYVYADQTTGLAGLLSGSSAHRRRRPSAPATSRWPSGPTST